MKRVVSVNLIIIWIAIMLLAGCSAEDVVSAPEITMELFGEQDVIINFGSQYIDEGVMAVEDNIDVSADVQITSNLDVNTIGEYTIK